MAEGKKKIKTFAVFDIQTRGLQPPNVDITEICIHGVSAASVRNQENTQRIVHQLVMAFLKPDGTVNFDSNAATAIQAFLNHLKKPVCLVAHNGGEFGFPILKRAFRAVEVDLPGDMKCIDSLEAPQNPHQVEGNVISMRTIMAKNGPGFVDLAENNAKTF